MNNTTVTPDHKEEWVVPEDQIPATFFRWWWGTMVILHRDRIPGGVISFASDIGQQVYPLAGVHREGFALYDSGEFGWLHGTRKARLYRLETWTRVEGNEAHILMRYTIGGWDQGLVPDGVQNFRRVTQEEAGFGHPRYF